MTGNFSLEVRNDFFYNRIITSRNKISRKYIFARVWNYCPNIDNCNKLNRKFFAGMATIILIIGVCLGILNPLEYIANVWYFPKYLTAVKTTFLWVIYVGNHTTNVAWCPIQMKLCKNNFCPSTVNFRHFSWVYALHAIHNYAHISWSTGNFVDLMQNSDSA